MQPLLPRLPILWRGAPILLCLCLSQLSSAQSIAKIKSQRFATPNFYLLGEDDAIAPALSAEGAEPDPMGLPDLPIPHPLLNLELQTIVVSPSSQSAQNQAAAQKDLRPATSTGTTFAQENAEFGSLSINGMNVVDSWATIQRFLPTGEDLNAREAPIVDPSSPDYNVAAGPYNWGGLLTQSLTFNIFENAFRAASDDQIRSMLAKKPFWHDWLASTKQFNMRRWNDGDDFLVNDIGHPLQGSVSGYIEIQNDPVGRQLEISADPAYWKSRFQAFLWATVYSTHSEISPDGEAGIGNEGGWTYPIRCKTPGCPSWNPRTMHSTNNTGWTDFIITPTVGILWLLAEDTVDRYVSDRLQGGDRFNLGYAFLRAGLNPSRSMANAMRFKAPWYRDFQHDPDVEKMYMVRSMPTDEEIAEQGRFRRFEISPYVHSMPFGSPAQPCILCFGSPGVGIEMDFALTTWLSASFAAQSQSGILQKGNTDQGSTTSVGGGLRFVHQGRNDKLSIAIRPGVVTDRILLPLKLDEQHNTYVHPQVNVEHAAVTLQASYDYKITKTVALRSSVSDTIVRYKSPIEDPPGIGKIPYLSWLSKDEYTNKSNWSAQTGPVIRF